MRRSTVVVLLVAFAALVGFVVFRYPEEANTLVERLIEDVRALGNNVAPQAAQEPGGERSAARDIRRIASLLVAESHVPNTKVPMSEQGLREWGENLRKQIPELSDFQIVMWFVNKSPATIPSLHVDGKFQPMLASEMGRRLANLPDDFIREWQAVLFSKYQKEDLKKVPNWLQRLETVQALVQVRALWKGDSFVKMGRHAIMAKLHSIPPGALAAWNQWYGSTTHADVAAQLLNVAPLFEKERFDLALFTDVAKVAITLWPDRDALGERPK